MADAVAAGLLVAGAVFQLLAAVGVLRMPDLFSRMQAAAKAATLGAGCIVIAAAIHFGSAAVTVRVLLVTAFLFMTAPVATHLVARAAYFVGVPLWQGTVIDELRGRYDPKTHLLGQAAENAGPSDEAPVAESP